MYEDVTIKLSPRFKFSKNLETNCNDLTINETKIIANILDQYGNFVFSLDENNILRQLNYYVHCKDKTILDTFIRLVGINKKIIPLSHKYFLNISMSQCYPVAVKVLPFLQAKKHVFQLFVLFYAGRQTAQSPKDIEYLQLVVNKLKDRVALSKGGK